MKRIFTLAIALIMVIVMSGCGGTPAPSETTGTTGATGVSTSAAPATPSTEERGDPVRVTFFYREGGNPQVPEKCAITDKILELINVEYVHLTPVGMGQNEYLQLLLSTGDIPDVMETWQENTIELRDKGIIMPLDDYLNEQYIPSVIKNMPKWEEAMAVTKFKDGHWWHMPVPDPTDVGGEASNPYIRTDWLRNLGLEMPTTLEELAVVLEAFSNGDPDGNGQNDTVGTMFGAVGGIETMMACSYWKWYIDPDGTVAPGYYLSRYKDYLKYLKGLIDTGAMSREVARQDNYQYYYDETLAGRVGYGQWWKGRQVQYDYLIKMDPNAEWSPMLPIKGLYDQGYYNPPGLMRQQYAVSAFCGDRLDYVWKLLDLLAFDDTSTDDAIDWDSPYWTINFGQRGVNWDVTPDGKFDLGRFAEDTSMPQDVRDKSEKIRVQNITDIWVFEASRWRTKWRLKALETGDPEWAKADNEILRSWPKMTEMSSLDNPLMFINTEGVEHTPEYTQYLLDLKAVGGQDDWDAYVAGALLGRVDIDQGFEQIMEKNRSVGYDAAMASMAEAFRELGRIK